ncbi:MAG: hypothetical protein OJF49_004290 [Ktedonobacterales bacterium]|jgi:hypothetical protein|nr:MAG: hypothetical protein OJF49_004290 [Ktedonobacterales bacterium]
MAKSAQGKVRTLYRPVGLGEVVAILEAGAARFPPRLPEQPIFYPMLTREYAEQITQGWNAPSAIAGYAGFVTQFQVDAKYAARFKAHVVGSAVHREWWVPAEQLEEFNQHLVGPIALVSAHYGAGYSGPLPQPMMLKGRSAREQLPLLERICQYNGMDFVLEVLVQRVAVQLNFAYWVRTDLTADGLSLARKVTILHDVQAVWKDRFPETTLLGSDELQELSADLQT